MVLSTAMGERNLFILDGLSINREQGFFCLQPWKLCKNNPEWWFLLGFETKGQEAEG